MADSFAAALAALQADLPRIPRTATGQHGKYPPYDGILKRVRPVLAKHGFVWSSRPTLTMVGGTELRFGLDYQLTHLATGHILNGFYPLTEGPAQQQGSQISYAKRYALVAVLDLEVVGEDNDGMERTKAKIPGPDHERLIPRSEPGDRPAERTRVVDNVGDNPWIDAPPGEFDIGTPEDRPGTIDERQIKAIGIIFRNKRITDDAVRHGMISDLIGRDILSVKQLSRAEAAHVIKKAQEAGNAS